MYLLLCAAVFCAAYALNIIMITVGYHRGLAHDAVHLQPWLRRVVIVTGSWITGLDPKAWSVMHRMHHAHSDTPEDPHSPTNVGLLGIGMEQLRSYEKVLRGLKGNKQKYTKHAHGLDFQLNWLNRTGRWYLPYLAHAAVALAFAVGGLWLLGLAYFFGMMSHPIQGGLVNAFGHASGGRNFDTNDNSRNNLVVALLVAGEGLQNNHHRFPKSAKFSYRSWEPDAGYVACRAFAAMGWLRIDQQHLIPKPQRRSATSAVAHSTE